VLPYFRKLESDSDFSGDLHGRSGPVPIRRTPPEHFSGKTAAGVEALVGGEKQAFSARETIIAGGGIFSPAILMRSGIGPAAKLNSLGLAVVRDLPGVGRNLQNHPLLFVGFHLRKSARQPDFPRAHHTTCRR